MFYLKMLLVFIRIGFSSFGGLTMIPIVVDEMTANAWLTEAQVMDIVALAEMTPGSMGINCATFVGYRLDGILCAVLCSAGVMVPSLVIGVPVAHFLKKLKGNQYVEHILRAIRPACVGMLTATILTLGEETFFPGGQDLLWNRLFIAGIVGTAIGKFRFSSPRAILLAAVLGVFIG